jgi:hypothetical protein
MIITVKNKNSLEPQIRSKYLPQRGSIRSEEMNWPEKNALDPISERVGRRLIRGDTEMSRLLNRIDDTIKRSQTIRLGDGK